MSLSSSHRIELLNNTDKSYHFAVYQRHPKSPGLRSVIWKVKGIPPKGVVASASFIQWSADYGVCIVDWNEKLQRFTERQIIRAQLGKVYKVTLMEGNVASILPEAVGDTDDHNSISLINDCEEVLSLGITVDLSLIAVQSVEPSRALDFCAESTYCVACYGYIQAGQVSVFASRLAPVDVILDEEYSHCRVSVTNHNGKRLLKVSKFCM